MGLSVSHSLSATTPNDPAFEIQPKHWNSGHIYTLNAVGSEISGAFGNGGGITFGLSADGNITAAAPAAGASINVSGGTTSNDLNAIIFGNSNGVSFGLGTGASSRSITATVKTDYLTTAMASNRGSDFVQATAGFNGTNNSGTIASNSISVSGLNQAVSAANGSYAFQTISFSNANGVSFGTSAGSAVTASHNALTSQSNQAASASNGSFTFQTVAFSNANNVTFGTSAGSIVTASVAATVAQTNQTVGFYATGNTTHNSSTTFDARTAGSWNAIGAATLGFSNGSVELSVPATSSIVGTNGISVSTNGSTISVIPQWISSFENMEGLVATATSTWNGASVSHAVAFYLAQPISLSFIRIPMSMTTQSTTIATLASNTASAQGGITHTFNAAIYSLGVGGNSASLQNVTTGTATFVQSQKISVTSSTRASYSLAFSGQVNGAQTSLSTQYSVSNTNYSFTTNQIATAFSGLRFLDIPCAASLTPGPYWMVVGMSSNSSSAGAVGLAALTNCGASYSNHYAATMLNSAFGIMGSTDFTSGGLLGAGSFSTAGGGTTNSIPISAISSNASQARVYFQMLRSA